MREPETGELCHRMQVRIRHDLPAAAGVESQFTPVCSRWVKVEPLGTATYAGGVQTGTIITHRLYCRFIRNLDNRHEFVQRGRVFRVRRPTEMRGRYVWSVIEVEEISAPDQVPVEGGDNGEFSFR